MLVLFSTPVHSALSCFSITVYVIVVNSNRYIQWQCGFRLCESVCGRRVLGSEASSGTCSAPVGRSRFPFRLHL